MFAFSSFSDGSCFPVLCLSRRQICVHLFFFRERMFLRNGSGFGANMTTWFLIFFYSCFFCLLYFIPVPPRVLSSVFSSDLEFHTQGPVLQLSARTFFYTLTSYLLSFSVRFMCAFRLFLVLFFIDSSMLGSHDQTRLYE